MGCGGSSSKSSTEKQDEEYDKAVLSVKVNRDKIKKYQARLEQDNEKEVKLAIKLAKEGKRERAKLVIKAKKAREAMINKADGMLATLQKQLNDLEQAKLTKSLADSLAQTNHVLKVMNENLTVEMVEELMDENTEHAERIKEINDLLTSNMSQQDQLDAEEEYERMLKELNQEEDEVQSASAEQESEPEQEDEEQEPEKPRRVAALA